MTMGADLLRIAEDWRDQDPDPRTAAELAVLLAQARQGDGAAQRELADAFDGTLAFGTAGLRGRLGPGSNRMNRVVVTRAAAGLAAYLRATGGHSIVIGYDARHNSDVFARDTAEVMAGAGIAAMVLPHALPTPVLAFAIRRLGASAGVMVTASHNPPHDNGYKVYLGDGRQIVSPADVEIAARIDAVGDIRDLPRSDDYVTLDASALDAYLDRLRSLIPPGPRQVRSVYTPMHGVGGEVFMRAAVDAGFPEPLVVGAQFAPDPEFPTVAFPNPEEPGAMDLALAEAQRHDADVIVAHDPDADRCAAGIRHGSDWRMLSGDELGSLLGWWTVQRMHRAGGPMAGTLAQSIVSGTMLRAIAEDAGLGYAATLTGFKWVSRVPGLVYGYEEALGYCVDPAAVADKDGVSAALLVLELAADLAAEGRTVQDVLDDLDRRFGVHATAQVSVRVDDLSVIDTAMARLRAEPPASIGGRPVLRVEDLQEGVDGLPPTEGLRFTLADARVIVRPSGTEPKLKCYLQAVVPVTGDLAAARTEAAAALAAMREDVSGALR